MRLYFIGFFVSLVMAIPTFGLSLIGFFVLKYIIDVQNISKIRLAALSAHDTDCVAITYVSNAAVEMFYMKYGTAQIEYRNFMNPALSYIGYVNVGRGETVVIINKPRACVLVSAIEPPIPFGNDLVSFIAKKGLIDELIQEFGAGKKVE